MLSFLLAFALGLPVQIPDRTQIQPPGARRSLEAGFNVIGQLSFENGAEATIVEIQLREPAGLTTIDRTTATMDGRFQFNGVRLGRYWVIIENDHYQWIKHQLDVDTRSFAMVNLDLSLYPKATLGDGTPVVSIEELRRDIRDDAVKKLDEAFREFRDDDADKGIERLAVEALLRRLELANPSAEDHFVLGSSYYRLARPAEAEQNLLRAASLAPEEAAGARLQLFNVYMRTRRPVQALEQANAYLEAFPDHPNHAAMKERADKIRKALQNNRN